MPRLQGAREPINAKDQMQWPTDESRGEQDDPQKLGARSLTLPAQNLPIGISPDHSVISPIELRGSPTRARYAGRLSITNHKQISCK